MEDGRTGGGIRNFIKGAAVFLAAGLLMAGASLLYGEDKLQIAGNVVLILTGTGVLLYLTAVCGMEGRLGYDNGEHFDRFALLFLFGAACAAVFPLIPPGGRPFLAVFVTLSLFGNALTGVAGGSVLLMVTSLLEENGTEREFFLYFLAGLVGIALFRQVGEEFRVGAPLFLSLLMLAVCLMAGVILPDNERLDAESFLVPAINLFVSLLLLLVALKYFSFSVVHRDRGKYMEINDQEHPLLTKLKKEDREEYYRAVHTAYFTERIARSLKLDVQAAKTCAYYHRIGKLKGENSWETVSEIGGEYGFPGKAMELLRQCVDKNTPLCSREAAAVLFSETVVSAVSHFFAKDPKADIDYTQLAEAIFRQKLESGVMDHAQITMDELRRMKKIFLEERLYYDFLR